MLNVENSGRYISTKSNYTMQQIEVTSFNQLLPPLQVAVYIIKSDTLCKPIFWTGESWVNASGNMA